MRKSKKEREGDKVRKRKKQTWKVKKTKKQCLTKRMRQRNKKKKR